MNEDGRTQYRARRSASGTTYARLDGEQWVEITDEEAKDVGIWRDPRGGQYAIKDELATSEQLAARDKGHYDPRPASGDHIALRVIARCALCGARVAEAHEYVRRPLVRRLDTGRWYWGSLERWSIYECVDCAHGIDLAKIWDAFERSKAVGKTITISG